MRNLPSPSTTIAEITQPSTEGLYFQRKYRTPSNSSEESDEKDDDVIEGELVCTPTWRLKERMKTTGVCMILALNIGTDPPDVSKPTPCATKLCWLDPSGVSRAKAREIIGERLEEQYAKWQQRVKLKYKRALDPTVEETRSLCTTMRRHAKSERLLFHYNGHGVPRPTDNGELWVFDKNHTQYIPLSVQELKTWIGRPTIVVLDCSNAGVLIPFFASSNDNDNSPSTQAKVAFHQILHTHTIADPTFTRHSSQFHKQQDQQNHQQQKQQRDYMSTSIGDISPEFNIPPQVHVDPASSINNCIVLCPCSEGELLPMNPAYPADIFTSCLTTPIPIALRWFVRQNQLSMEGLDPENVDRIPGKISDRKTPLGEMSWIFTAITDTIAWNVLPSALFQRLFRQDLLVASMFRNFLLADRILRSLNCTPISYPPLPMTANHPLWQSFDLAVESCLYQLMRDGHLFVEPKSGELSDSSTPKTPTTQLNKSINVVVPFFSEQLTAFEVWLDFTSNRTDGCSRPPEELPVVLQVLLSQAHRVRALTLLKRFLNLGPWAVNLALSVGIFPYVLKLLQSPVLEYRHVLIIIWAKILAFDISCQGDLVKDQACSHFINHLTWGLNKETEALGDDFVTESMGPGSVSPEDDAAEQRMMATFILSAICQNHTSGQSECIKLSLHLKCSDLLDMTEDNESFTSLRRPALTNFRMWLCICLARLCQKNAAIQSEFYNRNIHDRLFSCLCDQSPSVRAAAAYALGCLVRWPRRIGSQEQLVRLERAGNNLFGSQADLKAMFQDLHRMRLDISVACRLSESFGDASSLVRSELILSLGCVVEKYAPIFSAIYTENINDIMKVMNSLDEVQQKTLRNVWTTLCKAALKDPFPKVSSTANIIVTFIKLMNKPFETNDDNDFLVTEELNKIDDIVESDVSFDNVVNVSANEEKQLKPTLRRNMSDYFTRWTSSGTKVENEQTPSHIENKRLASSIHVDKIPLSLFGDRKYREFGLELTQKVNETDLLSQNGAIKAHRMKRNNRYHTHGFELMDKYVELHPAIQEKSKPENTYDFGGESPELIEYELRLTSKKQQLNMKPMCKLFNDNAAMTSLLRFHPYESILAVCDENRGISIFDYENEYETLTFNNFKSKRTRTTSVRWINEQSNSLLLTGCDDGTVQIWDNVLISSPTFDDNEPNRLATAFIAAPDISPTGGSGLVAEWQQYNGRLLVGGNSKYLRCWDLNTSQLVNSVENKSNSCMTVVTSAWDPLLCDTQSYQANNIGPNIVISGYGDGSMKVFDTRTTVAVTNLDPSSSRRKPRLMNYSEHKSWIVNIFFTGCNGNFELASGCVAGRVKFWDLRYPLSRRTIDVQRSEMTALAGHNRTPLFASGSHAQYIKLCTFDGDAIQVVRTHEHGPVSCLDFHPHKLMLAAGATDDVINIYSAE